MADVTEDQLSARIIQLSVFLPNRLGAILSLNRTLEAAKISIRGLSILDAADHVVVRMVVDQPTLAREILTVEGQSVVENELLAVVLTPAYGVRRVLAAIIMAELNLNYMYSLLAGYQGRPVLALSTEDQDSAAGALLAKGMGLLSQDDIA